MNVSFPIGAAGVVPIGVCGGDIAYEGGSRYSLHL